MGDIGEQAIIDELATRTKGLDDIHDDQGTILADTYRKATKSITLSLAAVPAGGKLYQAMAML